MRGREGLTFHGTMHLEILDSKNQMCRVSWIDLAALFSAEIERTLFKFSSLEN